MALVLLLADAPLSSAETDWGSVESAYRMLVTERWNDEKDEDLSPSHYTLTDIDKDGIPELLIGLKEVSYSSTNVYTFANGRAKLIGVIEEGHARFYALDYENGLVECYEAQGHIEITVWRLNGNSLVPETIYDEDFFGNNYPPPGDFVPNVRSLKYYKCNDMSGLSMSQYRADGLQEQDADLTGVEVGDTVFFGSYEQDNDSGDGKEAIEWIVLAKEGNRVLVISRYGLNCRHFHSSRGSVTWEKSNLRKWLNNTFIKAAFTEKERDMIPKVTVKSDKNPKYNVRSGDSTKDQIFVLSITEANEYLPSKADRKCIPTEYAVDQGVWSKRVSKTDEEGSCRWWLRSAGRNTMRAAGCDYDGTVYTFGYIVNSERIAVRPAMWIDLY